MYNLSERSKKNLHGVHPALQEVVGLALRMCTIDFAVIEGLRTPERQKQLVASGASKTLNSRHITGHAVDLAPWVGGTLRWDWPLFLPIADAMKLAAAELTVPIVWGGDWRTLKDGPHFELARKVYP